MKSLDKNKDMYTRSGNRSISAASCLSSKDFKSTLIEDTLKNLQEF